MVNILSMEDYLNALFFQRGKNLHVKNEFIILEAYINNR